MNFKDLLHQAREGRESAITVIWEMYRPLLVKNSIIGGRFDEDLYQELSITLLKCICMFRL